jgi:hypothetical protein
MNDPLPPVYVDPEIAEVLREIQDAGLPPVSSLPIAVARAQMEERNQALNQDPPDLASVSDLEMPGPGGPIRLRHYRPSTDAVLPLVIYFHGHPESRRRRPQWGALDSAASTPAAPGETRRPEDPGRPIGAGARARPRSRNASSPTSSARRRPHQPRSSRRCAPIPTRSPCRPRATRRAGGRQAGPPATARTRCATGPRPARAPRRSCRRPETRPRRCRPSDRAHRSRRRLPG